MATTTVATGVCPRPDKKALTRHEAMERVRIERTTVNFQLDAYQCTCGAWHLGKNRARFEKTLKQMSAARRHRNKTNRSR